MSASSLELLLILAGAIHAGYLLRCPGLEPVPEDEALTFIKKDPPWTKQGNPPCNGIMDGREILDEKAGWNIDDVTVSHKIEDGINIFTVKNRTPRDFENIKFLVHIQNKAYLPTLLQTGHVAPFSEYKFHYEHGFQGQYGTEKVEVILPLKYFKVSPKAYISRCYNDSLTVENYTEVTQDHQKNYAHALAEMKYAVNSPEFRKKFLFSQPNGYQWLKRAYFFDLLLTLDKTGLYFGVYALGMANKTRTYGQVIGNHLLIASQNQKVYTGRRQRGYLHRQLMPFYHELAHTRVGAGENNFNIKLQVQYNEQIKEFSQDCGVTWFNYTPSERYEDYVGMSAVYHPEEDAVYLFSGFGLRILKFPEHLTKNFDAWSQESLKEDCFINEPISEKKCAFDSHFCNSVNHENVEKCKEPTLYLAEESKRYCVRHDESCAWVEAAHCKKYAAYSGKKSTTAKGESCEKWAETGAKYAQLKENYCRSTPGKAPWCFYKDTNGQLQEGACFENCASKKCDEDCQTKLFSCYNEEKTCAWNRRDECKRIHSSGKPDCYEPSDDDRLLVKDVFENFTHAVKMGFRTERSVKSAFALVPFIRGNQAENDTISFFDADKKRLPPSAYVKAHTFLSRSVDGFSKGLNTLFNPQVLYDKGIFHGNLFCTSSIFQSVGSCQDIDKCDEWFFCNLKFKSGPAFLDLIINAGRNVFFFKDDEYIIWDSEKFEYTEPKPIETFLWKFGLKGRSIFAMS